MLCYFVPSLSVVILIFYAAPHFDIIAMLRFLASQNSVISVPFNTKGGPSLLVFSRMRVTDPTLILRLAILLILLGLANASPHERDYGHCENVVKRWASSAPSLEVKEDKHTLRDLLLYSKNRRNYILLLFPEVVVS